MTAFLDLKPSVQTTIVAHAMGYNPNAPHDWPEIVHGLTEMRRIHGEDWFAKEIIKLTSAPRRCQYCGR